MTASHGKTDLLQEEDFNHLSFIIHFKEHLPSCSSPGWWSEASRDASHSWLLNWGIRDQTPKGIFCFLDPVRMDITRPKAL